MHVRAVHPRLATNASTNSLLLISACATLTVSFQFSHGRMSHLKLMRPWSKRRDTAVDSRKICWISISIRMITDFSDTMVYTFSRPLRPPNAAHPHEYLHTSARKRWLHMFMWIVLPTCQGDEGNCSLVDSESIFESLWLRSDILHYKYTQIQYADYITHQYTQQHSSLLSVPSPQTRKV